MRWLVAVIVAAAVTLALARLSSFWPCRPNYRGEPVATGGGPVVMAGAVAGWTALGLAPGIADAGGLLFLTTVVMLFLGWLDDWRGETKVKGLRGHLGAWCRGKLDTALFKAVGGLVLGLAVGRYAVGSGWGNVLAVVLVAGGANALNLLDLRPGRALKGFGLGLILLGFTGQATALFFLPLAAAALCYAPYDLKERFMLGDAGANALGAALGAGAVLCFTPFTQAAVAVVLLALHIYAEKRSLTHLIERVWWLRLIDGLGRRG